MRSKDEKKALSRDKFCVLLARVGLAVINTPADARADMGEIKAHDAALRKELADARRRVAELEDALSLAEKHSDRDEDTMMRQALVVRAAQDYSEVRRDHPVLSDPANKAEQKLFKALDAINEA